MFLPRGMFSGAERGISLTWVLLLSAICLFSHLPCSVHPGLLREMWTRGFVPMEMLWKSTDHFQDSFFPPHCEFPSMLITHLPSQRRQFKWKARWRPATVFWFCHFKALEYLGEWSKMEMEHFIKVRTFLSNLESPNDSSILYSDGMYWCEIAVNPPLFPDGSEWQQMSRKGDNKTFAFIAINGSSWGCERTLLKGQPVCAAATLIPRCQL